MGQFVGFGNGQDGDLIVSTDQSLDTANLISSCSGTAGTRTLTVAAGLSFASGQIVLIHQSRGDLGDTGKWELAQIDSYAATTLTLKSNLENTYTDSGASQAQVMALKQYRNVTIDATKKLSCDTWNGDIYGILSFMVSGVLTINGKLNAKGLGFRGASSERRQGEGTNNGNFNVITSANGNGGGGAADVSDASGAGGGNGAVGSNGNTSSGGNTSGIADLTNMTFGGGGGSGNDDGTGRGNNIYQGNDGGGIILIFAKDVICNGVAGSGSAINADGEDNKSGSSGNCGGGGGGAGGSILIKCVSATLGTELVMAYGRSGNPGTGTGSGGGNGAVGRVRIEACTRTGTTIPAASEAIGGKDWCGASTIMM